MSAAPADTWVSWFINGEARHFPADSDNGRWIIEQLEQLSKPTGYCRAPKPLFRNQICGEPLHGRKGQIYCSSACTKRARRGSPECPPKQGSGPRPTADAIIEDIHSDLPGAPQGDSGSTVP